LLASNLVNTRSSANEKYCLNYKHIFITDTYLYGLYVLDKISELIKSIKCH